MNNKIRRFAEPGVRLYLLFLFVFAIVTLLMGNYRLAAGEGIIILLLIIYSAIVARKRRRQLAAYIEEITYDTENAKNNTLMNFPLPISVFRLDDSRIVWGNDKFFEMCAVTGNRLDLNISDILPQFNSKWLRDGHSTYPGVVEVNGHKYTVSGNIVRSENAGESDAFMGITYWVDVTEYENTRLRYQSSRPVAGIIVFDNMEEMVRNLTDRDKNRIRDTIEDYFTQWGQQYHAVVRRYERDRYLVWMEQQDLEALREDKFKLIETVHSVTGASGITASISIGLGAGAESFAEALQGATVAAELALSRGGDQAIIKNATSFEFYGGRGDEVEKRTKVRSRVAANALHELISDSSHVYVMGHKYADMDALGAAIGICCLARKCGKKAEIVIDQKNNSSKTLLRSMKAEELYKNAFITVEDAMLRANPRTLLVVVDTNRPEQAEDSDLLQTCKRVAVIDHHRVAATYIADAALSFIEPYASSACELVTEVLEEELQKDDITKAEANAILAGIVLDTKSFTVRTGDRTFDAAAWLRRNGADTITVKRLMQTDMEDTVSRYRILQEATLYRSIAIAAPTEPQDRVVAAKAADELLNISGVDASVVLSPDGKGGVFASARSIGNVNVQILMEKLGGGGNRGVAAMQMAKIPRDEALEKVKAAIDDYFDNV